MVNLKLKFNGKHYKMLVGYNCRILYMIPTSYICIKDDKERTINFKDWVVNFYRDIPLDNGYIKDQRYIIAELKIDPITKEESLVEVRKQSPLVLEKDYFIGNGVYIKGISKISDLKEIDYVEFDNCFNKWDVNDFFHFDQNYLKFIEEGERNLGQLLTDKIRSEARGYTLLKSYLRK